METLPDIDNRDDFSMDIYDAKHDIGCLGQRGDFNSLNNSLNGGQFQCVLLLVKMENYVLD
jgi:hypothetical protein